MSFAILCAIIICLMALHDGALNGNFGAFVALLVCAGFITAVFMAEDEEEE